MFTFVLNPNQKSKDNSDDWCEQMRRNYSQYIDVFHYLQLVYSMLSPEALTEWGGRQKNNAYLAGGAWQAGIAPV